MALPAPAPCALWTAESFRVSTKPGQFPTSLGEPPPRPASARLCVITPVAQVHTDFADVCFRPHGLRRPALPYGHTEHGHDPHHALEEGCQGSNALPVLTTITSATTSSVAGHASKERRAIATRTTSPRIAKPWASQSPHRYTGPSRHCDQRSNPNRFEFNARVNQTLAVWVALEFHDTTFSSSCFRNAILNHSAR